MDIATQICKKLGIDPNLILKKKIRGLRGYSALELIDALISTSNLLEASNLLGYSDNPIKQSIRSILTPKFPSRHLVFGGSGGIRDWRLELLLLIGMKYCGKCNNILPLSNFGDSNTTSYGKAPACKVCRNLELKSRKEYIIDRTPEWADLDLIKNFYKNCPVGYQVDHIIPLKGTNVSGLHVLSNLQYLTTHDNMCKSNNFLMEH